MYCRSEDQVNIFHTSLESVSLNVYKTPHTSFNPFQANVLFLYPLKTLEDLWFSDFLGGIEMEHWIEIGQVEVLGII